MKKLSFTLHPSYFILFLFLTGCTVADFEERLNPPRLATQTALAITPTATVMMEDVEVATPVDGVDGTASITTPFPTVVTTSTAPTEQISPLIIWINQRSEAHRTAATTIATQFTAQTNIPVQLLYITPEQIVPLARSAQRSGRLPDIIFHHNEYTGGLAAETIIDPVPIADIIAQLDETLFMDDVLPNNPQAIPSDGWKQLLVYREDWFDEADVDTPDNWESIQTGAATFDKLSDADDYDELVNASEVVVSGLVFPTDSDLHETQRVFEQIATSNDCRLVADDTQNRITLTRPECFDAANFYYDVVNEYSPPGYQTGDSALQAYLSGRTSLIITSPAVLPMLAGYNASFLPRCEVCNDASYLAENSGFVSELTGANGSSATFGRFNMIGITPAADIDHATQFVQFWFTDGYAKWLAVAPSTSVPLYVGENDEWLNVWHELPMMNGEQSIEDVFGRSLTSQLTTDLVTTERWGNNDSEQRLLTSVYSDLLFAPRLQRLLSEFTDDDQTLTDMTEAIVDVNRDYRPERTPTPPPTP